MGLDLNTGLKRLGVFGGSFDPVHCGHLRLAEEMREALGLDRVLFVPAQVSPFKTGRTTTPAALRARMVQEAIADNPHFGLWAGELDRPGPSFTVDTLRQLASEFPGVDLWFLTGADTLRDLPQWREPETILRLAFLAVGERPGSDADAALDSLPEHWKARIRRVPLLPLDIASTDLRSRVASGRSIRYLVPPSVAEIIGSERLYAAPEIHELGS